MNDIVIIALRYLERDYSQTERCIEATGLPVIWAERDGVGNYSRAFNEAFKKGARQFTCAWMISNITFERNVPFMLFQSLMQHGHVAVHPAMAGSDHQHQWPDGSNQVKPVPFIEWTAPMVNTFYFKQQPLVEELAYYYMDLQWSYEIQKLGYSVAVDHSVEVKHTYLRNQRKPERISIMRRGIREWWTPRSRAWMINKYGANWKELMQWK